MPPKITVIMSTHNVEDYIDECLQSISKQTFKDFLVLMIDDKSSDKTVSIIRKWEKEDDRFRLLRVNKKNQGLTKTLNELIKESDSELIARMDADDVALPKRFEAQVEFLNENKDISVVGTCAFEIDNKSQIIKPRNFPLKHNEIREMMKKANPMLHPSVMMRRNDLLEVGCYNEEYIFVQDYDLWFRFIGNNKRMANLNEVLMHYRVINTHVKKRNLSYRMIDFRIRWYGLKKMNVKTHKRIIYSSIPIILGIMPPFIKKLALKYSYKFDPRQQLNR